MLLLFLGTGVLCKSLLDKSAFVVCLGVIWKRPGALSVDDDSYLIQIRQNFMSFVVEWSPSAGSFWVMHIVNHSALGAAALAESRIDTDIVCGLFGGVGGPVGS